MAELQIKYLGLNLRNPIVIGSSGLTSSVDSVKNLEENGAGAVVLKSLFEEQILLEAEQNLREAAQDNMIYDAYSETLDYIDMHIKEQALGNYLDLIRILKSRVMIPVIASVNCVTSQEWTAFARKIEEAGADALELNIFVMPFNFDKSCGENEQIYYDILQEVKKQVRIPVSVKISPYFSNLGQIIRNLSEKGADGIVLFNRFAGPDIDVEKMKITVANRFSSPTDLTNTLRWVAVSARRVSCDLAASTGVHDGDAVIKMLLAGATVTEVTSAIYQHGPEFIPTMLNRLSLWMEKKGFNYIDQFRGKLSQASSENPDAYERLQFMKYFSEIK
ncbi:MAG: dihydroorotate dehydrogenase-like protein [Bacteroidales bacterium]|nr:dihydroorotate dehydrogenase-like protein [Bacteroidales bacterium]